MEGIKRAGVVLPIGQGMVLQRLSAGHGRTHYNTLYLDLFLILMHFPHTSGVPHLGMGQFLQAEPVLVSRQELNFESNAKDPASRYLQCTLNACQTFFLEPSWTD